MMCGIIKALIIAILPYMEILSNLYSKDMDLILFIVDCHLDFAVSDSIENWMPNIFIF